ncbi:MAG: D-alanine--D-alanine ligase [Patescibacteria group bacterium]
MTKKPLHIALIMGGPSHEHDVSLKTGEQIQKYLSQTAHTVMPVIVSHKKEWQFSDGTKHHVGKAIQYLKENNIDMAFIAMHGAYGEDGTIQGLLEAAHIPYTGSGVLASAVAMDKVKSSELFHSTGLAIPEYVMCTTKQWKRKSDMVIDSIESRLSLPLIVKPINLGSSIGITLVKRTRDLRKAIQKTLDVAESAIIQEYISGRELTCAILDDGAGTLSALLPTEIIPKNAHFFDYSAKYTVGASREVTPALISEALTWEVQNAALKAHVLLGCSGMSRTDFILGERKTNNEQQIINKKQSFVNNQEEKTKLYVLETNTIPGMTETSLLPQAALAVGISFPELLERILKAGLTRHERKAKGIYE